MSSDGPQRLRVLLGGGIGAGKSSVAALFAEAGFTVVEADRIGAEVLTPGTAATQSVAAAWPEAVCDGVVDRSALAQIVFSSESELARLEAITHPVIQERIESLASDTSENLVVEVPLITLDLRGQWVRIAVLADEGTRIARAIVRGGEPEDVRRRVASQVDDASWAEWADMVVTNSGAWSDTDKAVRAVVDRLML